MGKKCESEPLNLRIHQFALQIDDFYNAFDRNELIKNLSVVFLKKV